MKDKFSFHVSTMPVFWEKGLRKRYIAEPYVSHFYRLSESKEIVIAEFTRKNKSDYELTNNYLKNKVKQYRSQLYLDLNILHEFNYSQEFWVKALGLGFVRFVHMLYDGYQIASQFNPEQHQAYVLDESSYYTCQDFEDFRQLFQHSDFGFEQMFSLYIKTFHSEIYQSNRLSAKYEQVKKELKPDDVRFSFFSKLKKIKYRRILKKIIRTLLNLRRPTVGIFDSYFSYENMEMLVTKSLGRINSVQFNVNQKVDSEVDGYKRQVITENIDTKDRFDLFYKAALRDFFPTLYVESFKEHMSLFQLEAARYTELKYLVSEAWIGSSRMSLFIAVLQKQGVFHIYNEHNYLQHFILGNHIEQIKQMCDLYFTLGWSRGDEKKIKKGASLFPFAIDDSKHHNKSINYLYVGCVPMVKMPEINCAYGEQEENAVRYISSLKLFFNQLNTNVKNNLIYRPYPCKADWLAYDLNQVTDTFVNEIKAVDDFKLNSKEQMLKARLIIVDYLSTSYLEALMMNIPLIILFDNTRYFLDESHQNFFDGLISAGICHRNAGQAANFINKMGDGIEEWWGSKSVQNARKQFLKANIGGSGDAIEYYLSLIETDARHFG